LIRWPQEDGSVIPPNKFIPLAEDTGLIISIGEWVFKKACEQIVEWKEKGYKTGRMAVNIAGKQLQYEGFYEMIVETLDATGCAPEWIELEVTEGFVMTNPRSSIALLRKIRELGIEIAIDDFGTGYSSMTYLKQLPINTLKIDRSFIMDLPEDRNDAAITEAVIALAKGLELKLVAEGVETDAQKAFLEAKGCTTIQGYYYYKPLRAEELSALF
jgi:EAL domain-containing protein (putative c-di-GMP-specific phosphodiesterase class I)